MHIRYIVWLLFGCFLLCSCRGVKLYKKATLRYNNGEYYSATKLYRKANKRLKNKKMKSDSYYKIAICYERLGDYKRSAPYYKFSLRRAYPDSTILLPYAAMLRNSGKLDDARVNYAMYDSLYPGSKESQIGLYALDMMPEWNENPSRAQIKQLSRINSRNSDFGAIYPRGDRDKIIFASSRVLEKNKSNSAITGFPFYDLYISYYDMDRDRWEKPYPLEENEVINTSEDEGAISFPTSGNTLYFTRAGYNKNRESASKIYSSDNSGDEWSDPRLIVIGRDSTLAAHPSVSEDGSIMYFVSDMPGGYGGKDIWYIKKNGEGWSTPLNAGPIVNSPGDEMFPFIRDDGSLYFSSNYWAGLGGLDIFRVKKDEKTGKLHRFNMNPPINSAGDDFSIYFVPGDAKGLFTSNRKGARRDDIYSFVIPPITYSIAGTVYDNRTKEKVNDAIIRIVGTNGTNRRIVSRTGDYQIPLEKNTEYVIASFKKGYLNAKALPNTLNLNDSKHFNIDLYLTPTDEPIAVDNVYFDFGKWDVLEASKPSLDSVIQVLRDNPSIVIELMAHTDSKGNAQFNKELSQKRAQSVVQYLIGSGIPAERLVPKGYGESVPKKVTSEIAIKYPFLNPGEVLTPEFIFKKTPEQQDVCNQINRRTEFKVLSFDYKEGENPPKVN